MHKNASDSIADPKRSDTHSSQYYVNAPENDASITTDAPTEIDNTSSSQHAANFPHDTYPTAYTEAKIPTDQVDRTNEIETFRAELKTTYDLTLTQTSQTHTQTRQVVNIQLLQRHTEPLMFFVFFVVSVAFLLTAIRL